jgi:hypothetical protein
MKWQSPKLQVAYEQALGLVNGSPVKGLPWKPFKLANPRYSVPPPTEQPQKASLESGLPVVGVSVVILLAVHYFFGSFPPEF